MKTTMSQKILRISDSSNTTDFVLHKSQQTQFNSILKEIIDFTEHKLQWYADNKATTRSEKLVILALLKDYVEGHVAVAWKNGSPVYIKVTKDSP
jgi:hypothetical protein